MIPLISGPYSDFADACSRIKRDLDHAEIAVLGRAPSVIENSAKTKAWSYIWLSAALERYVKDALRATIADINASRVPRQKLRLSLFTLACASDFDSIKSKAGIGALDQRVVMLECTADGVIANFNTAVLPLDNRTIRTEHFETMWKVFGFKGTAIPTPLHRLALTDLADGRNSVAHGLTDPLAFGRGKHTPDVRRLVVQVEDIAEHLALAIEEYLRTRRYLR